MKYFWHVLGLAATLYPAGAMSQGSAVARELPHIRTVDAIRSSDCVLNRSNTDAAKAADLSIGTMFEVLQNYDFNGFATLGSDGNYRLSPELCNSTDPGVLDLAYLSESRAPNYVERAFKNNACKLAEAEMDVIVQATMIDRFEVRTELPPSVAEFARNRAGEALSGMLDRGAVQRRAGELVLVDCN